MTNYTKSKITVYEGNYNYDFRPAGVERCSIIFDLTEYTILWIAHEQQGTIPKFVAVCTARSERKKGNLSLI